MSSARTRRWLDDWRSCDQIIVMPTQTNANPVPFLDSYAEHAEPLRRFLYARLGASDVDDVFQDVWARAWTAWESFDGRNFRAWLFEIARNRIIDIHRSAKTKMESLPNDFSGEARETMTDVLVERELAEKLAACLEKLAEPYREVFVAISGGEGAMQVAARLTLKRETVDTRLHRARQLLHKCVNGATT
jgi:RNA polymerase sigma-70 factor (ECF subfamily)